MHAFIRCLLVLVSVAVLTTPRPVQAGLIPAAVTVTSDGSNFRFSYDIVLPSNYTLKAGDFFTIYDFHGYVASSNTQIGLWTFSTHMLGPNPPKILPTDSATVPNLTWTYNGPPISGMKDLGSFSADSTFGPSTISTDFASQDHSGFGGRTVGNITSTLAPNFEPPSAPEPATAALIAAGIPLVGLAMRRRRRAG